jgi:hypothetical protein
MVKTDSWVAAISKRSLARSPATPRELRWNTARTYTETDAAYTIHARRPPRGNCGAGLVTPHCPATTGGGGPGVGDG